MITVAHTAVATAAAIEQSGARPVFVDVDPLTLTLDPAGLAAAVTARTRAIVPVHLYGHPAPMGPILEFARTRGLAVLEDCAQAHGARYEGRLCGTMGQIAAFSFYPTKNVGAYGDGGAVVTDDPALAERVREIREYGWTPARRYVSRVRGTNSRLDEIQAAILRVKLRHLDAGNARRRRLADVYGAALAGLEPLTLPPEMAWGRHVYHLFVVRVARRTARGARRGPPGAMRCRRSCASERSGRRSTTRSRCTASRPTSTSATTRGRCRRRSGRPGRSSPCRCTRSCRRRTRAGWRRPSATSSPGEGGGRGER